MPILQGVNFKVLLLSFSHPQLSTVALDWLREVIVQANTTVSTLETRGGSTPGATRAVAPAQQNCGNEQVLKNKPNINIS